MVRPVHSLISTRTKEQSREESIKKVIDILRRNETWDDVYWCAFYEEVHDKLFSDGLSAGSIANWHVLPLFVAGIQSLQDLQRQNEAKCLDKIFSDGNVTQTAKIFFRETYNLDKTFIVKAHFSKSCKTWTMCKDGANLLRDVESGFRSEFNLPVAALKLFIIKQRSLKIPLDDERQVVDVANSEGAIEIEGVTTQIGFSDVESLEQALKICGPGVTVEENDESLLDQLKTFIANDNVELKHATTTIQKLKPILPISGGCEATRRAYIDPVLVAAARVVGGITMQVEKTVSCPEATGPVDYLFKSNNNVICIITEGKYDQHDKGVYQNIAQLAAVRSERKRKHEDISQDVEENMCFYGIATTFLSWQFTMLKNKKVKVSPLVCCSDKNVKDVVEHVAGMFEQCKKGNG